MATDLDTRNNPITDLGLKPEEPAEKKKNPRMDEGTATGGAPDLDLLAGSVQWATRADFRNIDGIIAAYQAALNAATAATKEQLGQALKYGNEFRSYVKDKHPAERQKILDGFNKLGDNVGTEIASAINEVKAGRKGADGRLQGLLSGHMDILSTGAESAAKSMSDVSAGNKSGLASLAAAEQSRISQGVSTAQSEMAGRTAAEQARTAAAGGAAVTDISARGASGVAALQQQQAADAGALQQQQAADVGALQKLTQAERTAAQQAGGQALGTVREAGKKSVSDIRKSIAEGRGLVDPSKAVKRIGAAGQALAGQVEKRFPGAIKTVSDIEKKAQEANTKTAAKSLGISGKVTANELGRINALAEAHQKSQASGFDSLTEAQQKMVSEGTSGLLKDVSGRNDAIAKLFGGRTGKAMGMLSNAFTGRVTDIKKQFGDSLKKRIASYQQDAVGRGMNTSVIGNAIARMKEESERQQASAVSEVTRQQAQSMTNAYSQLSGQELGAKRGDAQALNQLQQQRQGKIEDVNRALGTAKLTADQRSDLAQENLTAAAGGKGQAAAVQAASTLQGIRAREGETAAANARNLVANREGQLTQAGLQTLSQQGGLERAAEQQKAGMTQAGISAQAGLAGKTLGDIAGAAGRQQQIEGQAGLTAMGQVGAGQRGALGQVGAGQRGALGQVGASQRGTQGAVAGQLGRTTAEQAATGRAGLGAQAGLAQAGVTSGAAAGRQLMGLIDSEQGRNMMAQLGISRDKLGQVANSLRQGQMQIGDLEKMGLSQVGDMLKTGVGLKATTGVAGQQTAANMLAQQMGGEGRSAESMKDIFKDLGIKRPDMSELSNLMFRGGLGAAPPMLVADRGAGYPNLPGVGGGAGGGGDPGEPGDGGGGGGGGGDGKEVPFNLDQRKWDLLSDEEKKRAAMGLVPEEGPDYDPEHRDREDAMGDYDKQQAAEQTQTMSPNITVVINNLLSGAQEPQSWEQQQLVDEYRETGTISQETQTNIEQDPVTNTTPGGTEIPAGEDTTTTGPPEGTTPTGDRTPTDPQDKPQETPQETPQGTTPSYPGGMPPWMPGLPMPGFPIPGLPIPGPGSPGLPQPAPGGEEPSTTGDPGGEGQPGLPGGGGGVLPGGADPGGGGGGVPGADPGGGGGGGGGGGQPVGPPVMPMPQPWPGFPGVPQPAPQPGLPGPWRPGFPRPDDGVRGDTGPPEASPGPAADEDPVHRPDDLHTDDPAEQSPGPPGDFEFEPVPGLPDWSGSGGKPVTHPPGGGDLDPEGKDRAGPWRPGGQRPGGAGGGVLPGGAGGGGAGGGGAGGEDPRGDFMPPPDKPREQNPWGPTGSIPQFPSTGMGYPGNPITTDLGNKQGMEKVRQARARAWDLRNRREAQQAQNLTDLKRREGMRKAGVDLPVHKKLSRIEAIKAQKEAKRTALQEWRRKLGEDPDLGRANAPPDPNRFAPRPSGDSEFDKKMDEIWGNPDAQKAYTDPVSPGPAPPGSTVTEVTDPFSAEANKAAAQRAGTWNPNVPAPAPAPVVPPDISPPIGIMPGVPGIGGAIAPIIAGIGGAIGGGGAIVGPGGAGRVRRNPVTGEIIPDFEQAPPGWVPERLGVIEPTTMFGDGSFLNR